METIRSISDLEPDALCEALTVVIVREDITAEDVVEEDGTVRRQYVSTEHRMTLGEYSNLKAGRCAKWTPALHALFRSAQHRRTDDLYILADRKIRSSVDKTSWTNFRSALDLWNAQISQLAKTMDTEVPPLPPEPR